MPQKAQPPPKKKRQQRRKKGQRNISKNTKPAVMKFEGRKGAVEVAKKTRLGMGVVFPYEAPVKGFDMTPVSSGLRSARVQTTYAARIAPAVTSPVFFTGSPPYLTAVVLYGHPGLLMSRWDAMPQGTTSPIPGIYDLMFYTSTDSYALDWDLAPDDNRTSNINVVTNGTAQEEDHLYSWAMMEHWPLVHAPLNTTAAQSTTKVGAMGAWHGTTAPLGYVPSVGRFVWMTSSDCLAFKIKINWSGVTVGTQPTSNILSVYLVLECVQYLPGDQPNSILTLRVPVLNNMDAGSPGIPEVDTYTAFSPDVDGWYAVRASAIEISAANDATWSAYASQKLSQLITKLNVNVRLFLNTNAAGVNDSLTVTGGGTGAAGSAGQLYNLVTTLASWPRRDASVYAGWRHEPCGLLRPGTNGDHKLGHNCRVTGASLECKNITPVMSRGGRVLAARVRSSELSGLTWDDFSGNATLHTLAGETGVFTFVEPEDERYKWQCANPLLGGAEQHPTTPAVNLDSMMATWCYIMILCDHQSEYYEQTAAYTNRQTWQLTCDYAVEFRTTSPLYNTWRADDINVDAYRQMMNLFVARKELFFENPSHLAKMLSWVANAAKAGAGWAIKIAPRIAPIAAAAFPGAAPVITSFAALAASLQRAQLNDSASVPYH